MSRKKQILKTLILVGVSLVLIGGLVIASCRQPIGRNSTGYTAPVDNSGNTTWAPASHVNIVSFDSNGGTTVFPRSVYDGDTLKISETPTKLGYTFTGWYTDNYTFYNLYDFSSPVTRDFTLYAHWTEKKMIAQEPIKPALENVYDIYRSKLDFTGAKEYTVKSGDNLTLITKNHYGDLAGVGDAGQGNAFYFPVLLKASDLDISDPDLIQPGMKLTIIDLRKNLDNPESRLVIKDSLLSTAVIYHKNGQSAMETGLKKLADSL